MGLEFPRCVSPHPLVPVHAVVCLLVFVCIKPHVFFKFTSLPQHVLNESMEESFLLVCGLIYLCNVLIVQCFLIMFCMFPSSSSSCHASRLKCHVFFLSFSPSLCIITVLCLTCAQGNDMLYPVVSLSVWHETGSLGQIYTWGGAGTLPTVGSYILFMKPKSVLLFENIRKALQWLYYQG